VKEEDGRMWRSGRGEGKKVEKWKREGGKKVEKGKMRKG
jgi:hypothetical protein